MKLRVTKMHGAGNDFVVIDGTAAGAPALSLAQWRWLADRHVGVGADQILIVEKPTAEQVAAAGPDGLDFVYRIINADGEEVEQCGNGARCFVRFVHEQGLTQKTRIRVLTKGGIIAPQLMPDGTVEVDMGPPRFEPAALPFTAEGLVPVPAGNTVLWPLMLGENHPTGAAAEAGGKTATGAGAQQAESGGVPGGVATLPGAAGVAADGIVRQVGLVSMGNPHAVQVVPDAATAPVALEGPLIERHVRFPKRVNAGFMQVVSRHEIVLRVHERGAGETLACGTGACAAVVSGIQQGLLDSPVRVRVPGGTLTIGWNGAGQSVFLAGPAVTVFSTEVEIPAEQDLRNR
ncbi:MAG: diaminopimelate epimerase [Lautropia sp.]|nr:diaminopimelate epimerase [Lautropia sp.]